VAFGEVLEEVGGESFQLLCARALAHAGEGYYVRPSDTMNSKEHVCVSQSIQMVVSTGLGSPLNLVTQHGGKAFTSF
jgi:hypothetical protein